MAANLFVFEYGCTFATAAFVVVPGGDQFGVLSQQIVHVEQSKLSVWVHMYMAVIFRVIEGFSGIA